jgi:GT2 family glycosyltransferase
MAEEIHILLPVHNRREITRRFIQCLKQQTYRNYHLILIDDGSTDGTDEMVRTEIKTATILKGHGNWWWAGSLQQGYLWLKTHTSRDNIVLIINDDTEFGPDFIEKGVTLLKVKEQTLLLAQCFNRSTNALIDSGVHVDWRKFTFELAASPEQINCLSTRGLFLRVSDFFRIGGFYPRLLPHYLSDYEFTIRARRKGLRLCTDLGLKLWLDDAATGYRQVTYTNLNDFLKSYYSIKSALNPFQWSVFIALACPWQWKLISWLRIWKGTSVEFVKFVVNRLHPRKSIKL